VGGSPVAAFGGVEGEEDEISAALKIGLGPELGLWVSLGDDPADTVGIAVAPEVVAAHGLVGF
jgi:hypothetical protein